MDQSPLQLERDSTGILPGCVTLWLEQPGSPMVILDSELIAQIDAALDRVPSDATGFILASKSPRVFIAGADLKGIRDLDDPTLDRYLANGQRVFGRIGQLPCPSAAAINGAALGGGLEIAMHCDGLIGSATAKPFPIGLPETGLSICPGWGGTNLLPARIEPTRGIEATASGRPLKSDEATSLGLFDAIASSTDDLIATATKWLASQTVPERDGAPSRWIGRTITGGETDTLLAGCDRPSNEASDAIALAVRAGLTDGWQAALDVERRELVRLRSTAPAREAIAAFFERSTAGKK